MSKLFEKYVLNNNVEIKNRLVIQPMTIGQSTIDGSINDEEREYLKNRATSIGIYVFGATEVSPEGVDIPSRSRALSEKDLPSLTERANIIKSQGAKAIIQLDHRGFNGNIEYSGLPPVAPSAEIATEELKKQKWYSPKNIVHELTDEEIKKIIEDYEKATELCLKAGFDGVDIHAGFNNLLQEFFSKHFNKRTDEWGGSDEKRMNFILKVVDSVCKARDKNNRPDFIIGYRFHPEEKFEDGNTMNESLKLIKELLKKPLQYISISQKNFFQKVTKGEGEGTEILKIIHKETEGKMALIGVGGLRTESDFNSAMNSGLSEFVSAGIACVINPNLGVLLEQKKGDQINVEVDLEHPEYYKMGPFLWNFCKMGLDWLPPVKGKNKKDNDK